MLYISGYAITNMDANGRGNDLAYHYNRNIILYF